MIERPDADALLAGELGQWLIAQNAERAEVKRKAAHARRNGLIAAAVLFVALALAGRIDWGFKLAFGAGALGFAWAEWSKRPMLAKLKGGINGAIARAIGLDYSAECEAGQTFDQSCLFGMVPKFDKSNFSDLWWGLVAGQPFTLHEARLTETRGSGKNRHTVTVFEGQILSIGFNRRFNSTTLIEPDNARRRFFVGAEKEQATIGGLDLGRVDITNPLFEDRFTVWSDDQVEARYLIHPEYVERLLAVEKAFAGEDIRALFHGGDLLITLKTGNLFESGTLDAGEDRAMVQLAINQFTALADLAETLNEKARASFS
ncbi:DUF3137 domain-containing protein [Novosphingobium sp.]|uniref:DUF3137 domain-containing protein n=1 Tax=Novosphingobium sp. TaxID=1874826 RepID=UPI0025D89EAD|nr:DUF3137 domain-containing protein [Novosphingobium sp.]